MKNIFTSKAICNHGYCFYYFRLNILILSLFFLLCPNIKAQTLSAEKIYKKVKDAVVVILVYNDSDVLAAQGSGVVLNDKGYVVTNYHLLSGYKRLEIMHDKEIIPYVDIVGIDVEKDILILKIEKKKFPSVKIGNVKSLKVGQRIYAIGSPKGFENSISEGIISGLRSYNELRKNYIQITASISPGSSGGAVVNNKGELIGISTLTVKDGQNLNFAIPINEVLSVKIGSYGKNKKFKYFVLFNKGAEAVKKNNYNEAIKWYSIFIEIYPDPDQYTVVAYYNRGTIKSNLNDYMGAISDFNKAILINPYFENAYFSRGFSKSKLGDNLNAIQDYNKTIEINPSHAEAYYNRGVLKYNLGDKYGACLDWSKAGELGYFDAYDMIKEYCN